MSSTISPNGHWHLLKLNGTCISDWLCFYFPAISHYFVNGGWLESDDHIFKRVEKIRHIPTAIVQGRYDMVCPPQTAWELHKVAITT